MTAEEFLKGYKGETAGKKLIKRKEDGVFSMESPNLAALLISKGSHEEVVVEPTIAKPKAKKEAPKETPKKEAPKAQK